MGSNTHTQHFLAHTQMFECHFWAAGAPLPSDMKVESWKKCQRQLILEGNSLLLLFYLKIHILCFGIWTRTCEARTRYKLASQRELGDSCYHKCCNKKSGFCTNTVERTAQATFCCSNKLARRVEYLSGDRSHAHRVTPNTQKRAN